MENKMIFFDVDGTLIDCNIGIFSIPQEVRGTLDALKHNDHDVFLATGRCPCFITLGVKDYDFSGYVTCNGAYVTYQEKEVYKSVLPIEALRAIDDLARENDMTYYLEGRDNIYVLDQSHPIHQKFRNDWGMRDEVVEDDYVIDDIEVYLAMIVVKVGQEEKMIEVLSPYFDVQPHHTRLGYGERSFDLTLKGESKAKGIQKLVEALGKDPKNTVAVGDGSNDLEMLAYANIGIAMGNGCQEAKDVADYITEKVENQGITKAMTHFGFLGEQDD